MVSAASLDCGSSAVRKVPSPLSISVSGVPSSFSIQPAGMPPSVKVSASAGPTVSVLVTAMDSGMSVSSSPVTLPAVRPGWSETGLTVMAVVVVRVVASPGGPP